MIPDIQLLSVSCNVVLHLKPSGTIDLLSFAQFISSAAPLVWLYIVKNEILQESQKTNSARNWPISPFFFPASHFFMLKGPNSIFKFMKGQPYTLQSLQKGQKLTEYNLFMDRRMPSHTITLFVW